MGQMVRLTAADGHELGAYRAEPSGDAVGGIVVIQEIFGLTPHIKRVADQYAAEGFTAVAPALFDRIERDIVLDYTEIQPGIAYMQRLEWRNTLADLQAAIDSLSAARGTAVVGFCWGGTVAHVAAGALDIDAAVSYYGGGVARMLDKKPKTAVMYHFGDRDHSIPISDVKKIKSAQPDAVYHIYEGAGHGFNCEDRDSFSPTDARLAFERSAAFIRERLS